MQIVLNKISRRFNREWIFKDIDYTFSSGKSYAILGINGSGKSTLLQILSGALTPSSGELSYQLDNKTIAVESIFNELSIAAPYLELIEELTLKEAIKFHFNFKKRLNNITDEAVIAVLNMQSSQNKQIKYFSSGMKQRVKLAFAFLSSTAILLLDEPTSNLDSQGIAWYHEMVNSYTDNRLVIVCSNQEEEYSFCDEQLLIANYKTK